MSGQSSDEHDAQPTASTKRRHHEQHSGDDQNHSGLRRRRGGHDHKHTPTTTPTTTTTVGDQDQPDDEDDDVTNNKPSHHDHDHGHHHDGDHKHNSKSKRTHHDHDHDHDHGKKPRDKDSDADDDDDGEGDDDGGHRTDDAKRPPAATPPMVPATDMKLYTTEVTLAELMNEMTEVVFPEVVRQKWGVMTFTDVKDFIMKSHELFGKYLTGRLPKGVTVTQELCTALHLKVQSVNQAIPVHQALIWCKENNMEYCMEPFLKHDITFSVMKRLTYDDCMEIGMKLGDIFKFQANLVNIQIPIAIDPSKSTKYLLIENLSFTLDRISEELNSFQARITLKCSWNPDMHLGLGVSRFLAPDLVWHPEYKFKNLSSPTSCTILSQYVSSSESGGLRHEISYVCDCYETFELERFPLDRQLLHVQFGVPVTKDPIVIVHDKCEIKAGRCATTEWVLHAVRVEKPGRENEVTVIGEAERKDQYYLWNCMIPLFLIVSMGFVVYVFNDPSKYAKRTEISAGIIATIVFFKFAVGAAVTRTQYLTQLDWYILSSFLVSFFLIIGHCISLGLVVNGKWQAARIIDIVVGSLLAGFWGALHLTILVCEPLFKEKWSSLDDIQKNLGLDQVLAKGTSLNASKINTSRRARFRS
ncbi:hypothetical protein Pelo_7379 [Pelomyxa schiedti]|nr:hypothetical protein Pelo_7379 [Pelomyxa schiedti]